MASILFLGCAKTMTDDDKVLAKVSSKTITVGEFKSKIEKVPGYYSNIVDKNKKKYLDEVILEMLLYEDGIRRGLDRKKEVQEVLNEAKKKIVVARYVKEEVDDKIKVPEEDIKKFYDLHREEFKTPALWRASHILVANENEAKDILAQLSAGGNFEELARKHSMDATASRGGDVGYFREGQIIPDFEKVATSLKVGQMSGIVHTQFGYHIIKLTDKKDPAVESYEKARKVIESELKKNKRGELFNTMVANLKKRYSVEIKTDVLTAMDNPAKEKAPAGKTE